MPTVNGWDIRFYTLFEDRFDGLREAVRELRAQERAGILEHDDVLQNEDFKLFAALNKIIKETVPADPNHADFRLGKSLGDIGKDWRRVKRHGLPDRYRLFFRFDSNAKTIIFAWLNDDHTLRKANAKTDCYAVFEKMLKRKSPPADFSALLAAVQAAEQAQAAAAGGHQPPAA